MADKIMDIMQSIVKRGRLKKIKKMIDIKLLLKAINATTKIAKQHNDELWDLCPNPKHKDSSPSWSINVNPESDTFGVHSCFACGYKGNFVTLTRDKLTHSTGKEITNKEALDFIIKLFTLDEIDEDTIYGLILDEREQLLQDDKAEELGPKESSLPEDFKLLKPVHKLYWNYLTRDVSDGGRGVNPDLIDKYGIGFCNAGLYDKRIIIPFWQEGLLISFLARSILPTISSKKKNGIEFKICPECEKLNNIKSVECIKCDHLLSGYVLKKERSRYPKGSTMEYMLWSYDDLDNNLDYVILVEGASDKLRLESLGYKNVMCVFGNKISDYHVKLLQKFEQKIGKKLRVFLFPDADEGGDILITFANQKLKYEFNTFVVELPWVPNKWLDPGSASKRQIRIAFNTCQKLYKVYARKFENLNDI